MDSSIALMKRLTFTFLNLKYRMEARCRLVIMSFFTKVEKQRQGKRALEAEKITRGGPQGDDAWGRVGLTLYEERPHLLGYVEESMNKKDLKNRCLKELHLMATALGPTWEMMPFGSDVANVSTESSDLDIIFRQTAELLKQHKEEVAMSTNEALVHFLNTLLAQQRNFFEIVDVIKTKNIKLLKLRYRSLDCDISFQHEDASDHALANTQWIQKYAREPVISKLVKLVKEWAKSEGVCGASDHHLSSYSWTLMTIYFLMVDPKVKLPALPTSDFQASSVEFQSELNTRTLLGRFFEFYVKGFKRGREVVSPCLGKRLEASSREFTDLPKKDQMLAIQDPMLKSKNLGSELTAATCVKLFSKLEDAHDCFQKSRLPEPFKQFENSYEVAKKKLEQDEAEEKRLNELLDQPEERRREVEVAVRSEKRSRIFGELPRFGKVGGPRRHVASELDRVHLGQPVVGSQLC